MEPTLQIGDRILVNKLSYHLHGVDRGDIVVFSRPPAENCGGPEVNDLVKRVIGLPGDVISLSSGYVVHRREATRRVMAPRLGAGHHRARVRRATAPTSRTPTAIPANNYFVMGDNRTDSCDSRYWGPIQQVAHRRQGRGAGVAASRPCGIF